MGYRIAKAIVVGAGTLMSLLYSIPLVVETIRGEDTVLISMTSLFGQWEQAADMFVIVLFQIVGWYVIYRVIKYGKI